MEKSIKNTKTIVYVFVDSMFAEMYKSNEYVRFIKIGQTDAPINTDALYAANQRLSQIARTGLAVPHTVVDVFEFPYSDNKKIDDEIRNNICVLYNGVHNSKELNSYKYKDNSVNGGSEWIYYTCKTEINNAVNLYKYSIIEQICDVNKLLFGEHITEEPHAVVTEKSVVSQLPLLNKDKFFFETYNGQLLNTRFPDDTICTPANKMRWAKTNDFICFVAKNTTQISGVIFPSFDPNAVKPRKCIKICRHIYDNYANPIMYEYSLEQIKEKLVRITGDNNWVIENQLKGNKTIDNIGTGKNGKYDWCCIRRTISLNISKYSPEQVEEIKNILINEFC